MAIVRWHWLLVSVWVITTAVAANEGPTESETKRWIEAKLGDHKTVSFQYISDNERPVRFTQEMTAFEWRACALDVTTVEEKYYRGDWESTQKLQYAVPIHRITDVVPYGQVDPESVRKTFFQVQIVTDGGEYIENGGAVDLKEVYEGTNGFERTRADKVNWMRTALRASDGGELVGRLRKAFLHLAKIKKDECGVEEVF